MCKHLLTKGTEQVRSDNYFHVFTENCIIVSSFYQVFRNTLKVLIVSNRIQPIAFCQSIKEVKGHGEMEIEMSFNAEFLSIILCIQMC